MLAACELCTLPEHLFAQFLCFLLIFSEFACQRVVTKPRSLIVVAVQATTKFFHEALRPTC